jgi:DNA modification methylase
MVGWRILNGDCREMLATLSAGSVQTCVTSPPYFGLRDYGTGEWDGGEAGCDHVASVMRPSDKSTLERHGDDGRSPQLDALAGIPFRDECGKCGARRVDRQIGLEPTPDEFVAALVDVFREVRRVLRDDGTVWLNLGDSYGTGASRNDTDDANLARRAAAFGTGSGAGTGPREFTAMRHPYKPKDLIGIPWMVAFALRADGWYLRSEIIWAKRNCMPESVTDRPTKAHEQIFLLSKRPTYFYDADAVREEHNSHDVRPGDAWDARKANGAPMRYASDPSAQAGEHMGQHPNGRNKRSVWTVATAPFSGAHFACVDAATEALTPFGWRAHDELSDGDEIAAYDRDTGRLEWQAATFHRYDYDGDLVAIEKRDLSQRLTPTHRCLVKSPKGHERIVTADTLTPGCRMPVAASFDLPDGTDEDARWGALLGWWITEGHDRGGNAGRIYQSESANPEHVATIRELLSGLGVDFSEHRREREWRGRPAIEIEFRLRGRVLDVLRGFAPGRKFTLATLDVAPRQDVPAGAPRRADRR